MTQAQIIRSPESGASVFKAAAARFRSAFRPSPEAEHRRRAAMALRELAAFEDYQLSDLGLRRTDITPQGLEAARIRRGFRQAMIDRECAAQIPESKLAA